MEGQLGAPFHFAVEFLVLVVALGGAVDALRARRHGAGRWALGQALGFLSLAGAQFIHGSLIVQSDANTTVIVLRSVAFGLLALTARPAVALERAPLEPIIAASAMPALFFTGTHATIAVIPAVLAVAVAARGLHAYRIYLDRTTLAFTAAFAAFAVSEVATAASGPGTGALLIFAHAMRAVAALLLARWLWASIVRSVRMRFVAAFVAVLTIAVLIVSAALNVVIGNTLQTNELNRLLEAGNAREASIQNLGEGALVPAQITASSSAVLEALRREQRLDLSGLFKLLPLDFVMLVDGHGKTLCASQNLPGQGRRPAPPCSMPLSEAIGIAGSPVVHQAWQSGFQGETTESVSFASGRGAVQSQMLVVAAYPARQAGRVIGAVVVGYRIDHNFLLLVRQDTVAEATILVGDQVSSTTFKSVSIVSQAFSHLDFTAARENGTALQRIVTIGGNQYVTAFVPLKASDGSVVGLLALSRQSTTLADAQRNITRTLFLITLAVALIAALLAWLSGGRVTEPIRSLTAAARQLRAGQLAARTRVESTDEVGSLGTAFNEMADELQRQTGQLQRSAATEATLRARMEAILQSMGDGLIATDAAGTVVTFNRAAEEILRKRAQSVVRRPLAEVMQGQAITGRALADAAMLGGATEGTLARADGTQLPVAM
ncbi:MAG TPA: HAMP domain-containing protein, partial [Actinomycetota bacterium]|nr:HAMP domain-containing protein [Actinomycetota bacterium]